MLNEKCVHCVCPCQLDDYKDYQSRQQSLQWQSDANEEEEQQQYLRSGQQTSVIKVTVDTQEYVTQHFEGQHLSTIHPAMKFLRLPPRQTQQEQVGKRWIYTSRHEQNKAQASARVTLSDPY